MWKHWLVGTITLLLAACAAPPPTATAEPPVEQPSETGTTSSAYPVLSLAPEIVGDVWLNTDEPLRLDGLQGKVVLIDMWTFG